jgi:hypothetical protein
MSAHRKRSGNRRKASGSFQGTELAREPALRASTTSSTKKKNKKPKSSVKPKKEVKIQGILKKKENAAPPPVAFFGGTVVSSSSNDSSSESNCDGESVRRNNARNNSLDEKSLSSMKSGMRRGKYAAINETALSVTHRSSDDADDSSIESSESERSKFDEIQSDKFDRDHSHFLRTADLGMTQDTIFAQQFLDNSNDSPEPHFHHPTPHPPPGVQFHVDENWICVDDGKGNHSPIAPQAVDGLAVMAYQAANDPMMWTPTNITRKMSKLCSTCKHSSLFTRLILRARCNHNLRSDREKAQV